MIIDGNIKVDDLSIFYFARIESSKLLLCPMFAPSSLSDRVRDSGSGRADENSGRILICAPVRFQSELRQLSNQMAGPGESNIFKKKFQEFVKHAARNSSQATYTAEGHTKQPALI
ncbi:hypothetical protein DSO57_1017417 [Entomophthora muscae]|uniref:Uncharacterized protein n=1 Tax=Entomophthora muscae TaxID=34485 RepID=A0ACC2TFJ3_9FUNG|nr:hypothetical protein DSO57_1017417 [Entomophthora muscae]